MFNLYQRPERKFWRGRVDQPETPQNLRWHQVVKFLDLNKQQSHTDTGFCILGYACDEGIKRNSGRSGAKSGPEAIRAMLGSLPIHDAESFQIYDAGNIICRRNKLEATQLELNKKVQQILSRGLFPVVLGGGHDVAHGHYSGLKAFHEHNLQGEIIKNIGIINFDAHFDLRPYTKGATSGSPFLQIANDLKKQGENFHYLVIGTQKSSNTKALYDTANKLGVRHIPAEDFNMDPLEDSLRNVQEFLKQVDAIQLTFCLDAMPASVCPGVSAPNPMGLNPHRTLAVFKQIITSGKVIGFDVAELSPPHDIDNHTARFAAQLVFQICTLMG